MAKKGKYSSGADSSGSLVKGLIVVMGILVLFSLGLRLVIGSAGSGQPQLEATTVPTVEEPVTLPSIPEDTQPESSPFGAGCSALKSRRSPPSRRKRKHQKPLALSPRQPLPSPATFSCTCR